MADVTGPISTLPYSLHDMPEGTMCDEHPDRPAVVRIQGETDSFGSEMRDCCQECADEIKAERNSAHNGTCEWCKQEATDLRARRDIDEGLSGRVYEVCGACAKKDEDALRAEIEALRHERNVLQKICAERSDEIERLRALLKPFADYAQMIDENPASAELGDACPVLADPSQVHIAARPTLADLRRARSAFEQHAPKSVCDGDR